MSDQTDLVKHVYETWNAQGVTAIDPWLADGVELQDAPELPDSGSWRGRAAVLMRLEEVGESVGGGWVDIWDVRAIGTDVVVSMHWQTDEQPGSAAFGDVFHVVSTAGQAITMIRVFLTESAAREAAFG